MRWNCSARRPDLDVLYVPIGQGSGICGCIMARDLLGRKTEIVGVQSTEAPSYALSFAAGKVVNYRNQQHAGRRHGDPHSRCRGAGDHPQGCLAHRAGHRRRGRLPPSAPTGPTRITLPKAPAQRALAAALVRRRKTARGKRVGLILTGGNIDFDLFREWVGTDATLRPLRRAVA